MGKNPDILEICPASNKRLFGYYFNQRLNSMIQYTTVSFGSVPLDIKFKDFRKDVICLNCPDYSCNHSSFLKITSSFETTLPAL